VTALSWGRPVSDDVQDEQGRNVIERCSARIEHWRGLATRYVMQDRGGTVLGAALLRR
jgi:hypothetical protein